MHAVLHQCRLLWLHRTPSWAPPPQSYNPCVSTYPSAIYSFGIRALTHPKSVYFGAGANSHTQSIALLCLPINNIVRNNPFHARMAMNHQSDDSTSLPCRPESGTYSLTWHNALQSNYITLPATIPSTLLILTHGVATLYTNKQYVAATHVPFRPGRVTYFLISHSTPTSN